MKYLVVALCFLLLAFGVLPVLANASEPVMVGGETSTSVNSTPTVTAVNSFELFWPLVAGKTRGEKLYFLKTWKENIRGWLIFGVSQKGEYRTLLATKRVLEAEKLINEGKFDFATQTESSANNYLAKSLESFTGLSSIPEEVNSDVKNRMDNLIRLVDELRTKTLDKKDLNEQVNLTHELIVKILQIVTPKS